MNKVVSIYEAKTNLSKYVKRAEAGETIYIGAYGAAQAVIAPIPAKKPVRIGIWARKKKQDAYQDADLVGPDADISAVFEASLDRDANPDHLGEG